MAVPMQGVFAVSTTPYDSEGHPALDKLTPGLERVLAAGVDGVLTQGATGEALALTPSERQAQVQHTVEVVDRRVPVVVGCMAYRPDDVVDLIAEAAVAGADAVMVTPPFYGGLAPEAAIAALDGVLQRSELPVMIYNNPHSTGVDLLPHHFRPLMAHSTFWSVKETSGGATRIRELRAVLGNEVEVFVGADGIAFEGFTQGASGWVAASAYLAPHACTRLWSLCRAGDWNRAVDLWNELSVPLGLIEASPAFISLIKESLGRFGLDQGQVRLPLPTATAADVAEVVEAIAVIEQETAHV